MAKIVECIPNISEGCNQEVIDAIVGAAKNVPGVTVLDVAPDVNHNRTVITIIGDPEGIAEAAFQLCKKASEKIDMTKHKGEHPRMGATDVIPFLPIKDVTIEECVEISKSVAKRIWEELKIPCFLYSYSASRPEREKLPDIRKGEFEGMPEKLLKDEWAPDYGERKIHPTAGVTAVGSRPPLVAFNINLGTSDVKVAKEIAKVIRGSSGGYKYCQAAGMMLEDRNVAQVSINMIDYEKLPLYRVLETVRFEAQRWGVPIIGSEIIGLLPAKALADTAEYYLQVEAFDFNKQVLENHLL